jgi:hypothetical protein
MDSFDQVLVFRRFRLNVIRFLRLSLDVNERALRDAIRTASPVLLATYEWRAARAQSLMSSPGANGLERGVPEADRASN